MNYAPANQVYPNTGGIWASTSNSCQKLLGPSMNSFTSGYVMQPVPIAPPLGYNPPIVPLPYGNPSSPYVAPLLAPVEQEKFWQTSTGTILKIVFLGIIFIIIFLIVTYFMNSKNETQNQQQTQKLNQAYQTGVQDGKQGALNQQQQQQQPAPALAPTPTPTPASLSCVCTGVNPNRASTTGPVTPTNLQCQVKNPCPASITADAVSPSHVCYSFDPNMLPPVVPHQNNKPTQPPPQPPQPQAPKNNVQRRVIINTGQNHPISMSSQTCETGPSQNASRMNNGQAPSQTQAPGQAQAPMMMMMPMPMMSAPYYGQPMMTPAAQSQPQIQSSSTYNPIQQRYSRISTGIGCPSEDEGDYADQEDATSNQPPDMICDFIDVAESDLPAAPMNNGNGRNLRSC